MKLLGISGTNGSGKDTVGEMLAQRYGWVFISISQMLRDELAAEGLPQDRTHTHELSSRWRRESGMGVMVDKAVEKFKEKKGDYKGLAISSLRHPGEAEEVHRLGGKIIWIDADIKIRYERIKTRKHGRAEDSQSFDEFIADEEHQMSHSGDDATLNMLGVKKQADVFIENNGSDLEEFAKSVETALANFL
jgi:cytidylate kinase